MMKRNKRNLGIAAALLLSFVLWTAAICMIDVQPIGPEGSSVGFAALNGAFHSLTCVHMLLYSVTDWLGLVPLGFATGFACLGLAQWVSRRSLRKVDRSILVLGVFFIVVLAAYVLFEMYPVNYRPVLIEGVLEASYPSSTTLLVLCIMPTAIMQLNERIRNQTIQKIIRVPLVLFTGFMVVGRLISGVHWLTDIVGSALLSAGLVVLYHSIACKK